MEEARLSILRIIANHDGQWNWYQIWRASFDLVSEYPTIKPSDFVSAGFVVEKQVANEPLPRIHVTELGWVALHAASKT